jgi:hypothetical protein
MITDILDAMSEPSGDDGRLSAELRARLRETIAAELRRAWDEAVAAGVPTERLAEVVEQRRREIMSGGVGSDAGSDACSDAGSDVGSDDGENGGDDAVENGRVGN